MNRIKTCLTCKYNDYNELSDDRPDYCRVCIDLDRWEHNQVMQEAINALADPANISAKELQIINSKLDAIINFLNI